MGKDRYFCLRKTIDRQSDSFSLYLKQFFPKSINAMMEELSVQAHIYIFSGVIKNFLLGFLEHRDLDIVISHTQKLDIHAGKLLGLGLTEIKRNKFRGLKLVLDRMDVDIWRIEDTMGIRNMHLEPTPENLIKTSFFNFSSIVFDYNNGKFIYGNDFCRFLMKRELDVVYEVNPFVESCIVSTFYYAEKYELSVSRKLCDWIRNHYADGMDFRKVQLKRYDKVYYSNALIFMVCKTLLRHPYVRISKIFRKDGKMEIDFK